jgi:uncharacterized membrane protein YdjX (TVP38/TMEM64 family)
MIEPGRIEADPEAVTDGQWTRETGGGVLSWVGIALVVLIVAMLLDSESLSNLADRILAEMKVLVSAHPVEGAVLFFIFSALSSIFALLSSAVIVPPASEAWGKPIAFLILWAGWVAGAAATYGLGRLARPLVIRMGYRQQLERYQKLAHDRMKFWHVLLFCIALPTEVPGYVFGGMRYPFWRFFAASAISEGIYALGTIIAVKEILDGRPGHLIVTVGLLGTAAVASGFAYRAARKRR